MCCYRSKRNPRCNVAELYRYQKNVPHQKWIGDVFYLCPFISSPNVTSAQL